MLVQQYLLALFTPLTETWNLKPFNLLLILQIPISGSLFHFSTSLGQEGFYPLLIFSKFCTPGNFSLELEIHKVTLGFPGFLGGPLLISRLNSLPLSSLFG